LIFCSLGLLLSFPERANSEIFPFSTRNQSPHIAIFGIPHAERASGLDPGTSEFRMIFNAANSFTADMDHTESIFFDGETYRSDLILTRGISKGFSMGIAVPFISHSGGFLDPVINLWHEATGLPNGGRDDFEDDRLRYRYTRSDHRFVDVDETESGLGDIRVFMSMQLEKVLGNDRRSVAVHTGLKIPTGDPDHLTGSGAADLSLSLAVADHSFWQDHRLTIFGSGGLLISGKGQVLESLREPLVGFGSIGIGWKPFKRLAPKIQLDWHSPLYENSTLKQIDAWSAQLVLGGTVWVSEKTQIDLGIVEDVIVNTSPDVVFHFAFRSLF
jgi:hypothetical protein